MTASKPRSRRTLLGAVLAATGLAGTGIAAKLVPGAGAGPSDPGSDRRAASRRLSASFFVDHYTLHTSRRGPQREKGDQTLLRGTLLTSAGERVGEVFASAVTMPGPATDGFARTARMETQNIHLADGTVTAMGTVFSQVDIPNVYTVVGGTGLYAGARGTCQFNHNPVVAHPDGRATLVLDLVLEPVNDAGSAGGQL